eukprot:CAMPEP_0178998164 /NCGR_PEP_ID=MMETSP0795-20121207/9372_1 /TAXON_ID=88552 /ORGANISM="Amoebophrya sp., Strain Ameob2" /LENGTH=703 /DNA_ID=CAMNT_0020690835 /DNA_START=88 /DNA_END=2199 /DNA_ORIENTATION=-
MVPRLTPVVLVTDMVPWLATIEPQLHTVVAMQTRDSIDSFVDSLGCGPDGSSCGAGEPNLFERMVTIYNSKEAAATGTNYWTQNWAVHDDGNQKQFTFPYDKTLVGPIADFSDGDAFQLVFNDNEVLPIENPLTRRMNGTDHAEANSTRFYEIFWNQPQTDGLHEYYYGLVHFPRFKNMISFEEAMAYNMDAAGIDATGRCVKQEICGGPSGMPPPDPSFENAHEVRHYTLFHSEIMAKIWPYSKEGDWKSRKLMKEDEEGPPTPSSVGGSISEYAMVHVGAPSDLKKLGFKGDHNWAELQNKRDRIVVDALTDSASKKTTKGNQVHCDVHFVVPPAPYFSHKGFLQTAVAAPDSGDLKKRHLLVPEHILTKGMGGYLRDEFHEFGPVVFHRPLRLDMMESGLHTLDKFQKAAKAQAAKKPAPGSAKKPAPGPAPAKKPAPAPAPGKKTVTAAASATASAAATVKAKKKKSASAFLQHGEGEGEEPAKDGAGGKKESNKHEGHHAPTAPLLTPPERFGTFGPPGEKTSWPWKSGFSRGPDCASMELADDGGWGAKVTKWGWAGPETFARPLGTPPPPPPAMAGPPPEKGKGKGDAKKGKGKGGAPAQKGAKPAAAAQKGAKPAAPPPKEKKGKSSAFMEVEVDAAGNCGADVEEEVCGAAGNCGRGKDGALEAGEEGSSTSSANMMLLQDEDSAADVVAGENF